MPVNKSKRIGQFDLLGALGCFGGCKFFRNCSDCERQRLAAHD
jgi:hypothetical protein